MKDRNSDNDNKYHIKTIPERVARGHVNKWIERAEAFTTCSDMQVVQPFFFFWARQMGEKSRNPWLRDSSDVLGSVCTQETEGGDDSTTAAGVDLEGGANAAPQMSTN